MQSYQAQPYAGEVALVVAAETVGHTEGWGDSVAALTVLQASGDHDSMLTLPMAGGLARSLFA